MSGSVAYDTAPVKSSSCHSLDVLRHGDGPCEVMCSIAVGTLVGGRDTAISGIAQLPKSPVQSLASLMISGCSLEMAGSLARPESHGFDSVH